MLTGNKIPFINENDKMKKALDLITKKKLGVLIAKNSRGKTTGIITDGQIRRFAQKKINFKSLPAKKIMTKKPVSIDKNELAAKALSLMNNKKALYASKENIKEVEKIKTELSKKDNEKKKEANQITLEQINLYNL